MTAVHVARYAAEQRAVADRRDADLRRQTLDKLLAALRARRRLVAPEDAAGFDAALALVEDARDGVGA